MSAVDPQFAADFTDRYAPYLNPLPQVNSFREFLKFAKSTDRSGKQFRYPVQAAISHGQTSDKTGTAFAMNAARPGVEVEAILDGTDLIMRETFPYSAMLKARNGTSLQGDAAAYWDPMDKVMMTTLRGMEFYNELMLMWGPGPNATGLSSIGTIATTVTANGVTTWNNATHPIINITQNTWAAGIWQNAGSGGGATSGMLVDVYQSDLTTLRIANVQVEGVVDPSLCQVQMTGGSATTITAGDVFVPKGWVGTSSVGVGGILRNTGTFANINANINPFWRARSIDLANSAMTSSKLFAITAKLMSNTSTQGEENGLVGFCNPIVFSDLVDATVNNTRWINSAEGQSNKVKTQGADTLEFITAVGSCKLQRHPYMKQGEMWFLEPNTCMRIGASDITFRGANGNEGFFLELSGNAGSEIRAMSQQAALLTTPFHCGLVTGIRSANNDKDAGNE